MYLPLEKPFLVLLTIHVPLGLTLSQHFDLLHIYSQVRNPS